MREDGRVTMIGLYVWVQSVVKVVVSLRLLSLSLLPCLRRTCSIVALHLEICCTLYSELSGRVLGAIKSP